MEMESLLRKFEVIWYKFSHKLSPGIFIKHIASLSAKRYVEHISILIKHVQKQYSDYRDKIDIVSVFDIYIFSTLSAQFSPYNKLANLFTSVSRGWLCRTRIICPSSSHMSLSILKRSSNCSLLIELC